MGDNFRDYNYMYKFQKYKSKNNNQINISVEGGVSKMWFGKENGFYQSMYNLSDIQKTFLSYVNVILLSLMYINNLDNVLFVGLGGGHIPMIIRELTPCTKIDVVEINPQVLDAAIRMGFVVGDTNIIIKDGIDYFASYTGKPYDLIIIDLDSTQSICKFNFHNVVGAITVDSICVINACGKSSIDLLEKMISNKFCYIDRYKSDFNTVYILSNGNKLVAKKNSLLSKYKYKDNLFRGIKNYVYAKKSFF
jgi:spermidine synthase